MVPKGRRSKRQEDDDYLGSADEESTRGGNARVRKEKSPQSADKRKGKKQQESFKGSTGYLEPQYHNKKRVKDTAAFKKRKQSSPV